MEFFSFIREFGSNSGKKLEFLFCRVFKKLGHLQRQICQVAEFFKKSTKIKLDFFENSAKKLEFCSVWVGPESIYYFKADMMCGFLTKMHLLFDYIHVCTMKYTSTNSYLQ